MGSFVSLRSHASVIVRVLDCKRLGATDSGSVIYYICATQCPNDVVPTVESSDFCFKYHAAQDEVKKWIILNQVIMSVCMGISKAQYQLMLLHLLWV